MAGDWIKLRNELPSDLRLLRIARECRVPVPHAIGSCVMFWTSASDASKDGLLPLGVEDADVDHMGLLPGLAASLRSVGWLETDEASGRLRLPGFDRFIGSAKERAAARERQRDSRAGRVTVTGRDKPPLSQNVTVTKRDCHIENEKENERVKNENRVRARESAPKLPTESPEAVVWAAFDPVLKAMFPNGWMPERFVARLNDLACDLLPNTPAERQESLLAALAAWLPTTRVDTPQGAIGLLKAEWARCLDSKRDPGDRTPLAPIVTKPTQYVNGTQDQAANIAAMEAALNRKAKR